MGTSALNDLVRKSDEQNTGMILTIDDGICEVSPVHIGA
jgi:hypothetical protein